MRLTKQFVSFCAACVSFVLLGAQAFADSERFFCFAQANKRHEVLRIEYTPTADPQKVHSAKIFWSSCFKGGCNATDNWAYYSLNGWIVTASDVQTLALRSNPNSTGDFSSSLRLVKVRKENSDVITGEFSPAPGTILKMSCTQFSN